jgi:cytochrome b
VTSSNATSSTKIVWDVPTRLVHWSVAILVGLNLLLFEDGEDVHRWIGYAACAVVLGRFIWSLGPRFKLSTAAFPIQPAAIFQFIKNRFSDPAGEYPGHNPLAALVYLLIWTCILLLGLTGWLMGLDAFWGEDWLENTHSGIANILQTLIAVHLLGVFSDSYRHKRRTWTNMMTGKKAQ